MTAAMGAGSSIFLHIFWFVNLIFFHIEYFSGACLSDMNKKAIKLISLTYQGKLISLPAPGNFIKLHYMLAESVKLCTIFFYYLLFFVSPSCLALC